MQCCIQSVTLTCSRSTGTNEIGTDNGYEGTSRGPRFEQERQVLIYEIVTLFQLKAKHVVCHDVYVCLYCVTVLKKTIWCQNAIASVGTTELPFPKLELSDFVVPCPIESPNGRPSIQESIPIQRVTAPDFRWNCQGLQSSRTGKAESCVNCITSRAEHSSGILGPLSWGWNCCSESRAKAIICRVSGHTRRSWLIMSVHALGVHCIGRHALLTLSDDNNLR